MNDHKIYNEIVKILNEKNYDKNRLANITKDTLKEVFREVYNIYGSLGGIDKSPKVEYREAAIEIINEEKNKNKNKEDEKSEKSDEDSINIDIENEKNDSDFNEIIQIEDYEDDLIQPEFPKKYCKEHEIKIQQLAKKLELQREAEMELRKRYDQEINQLTEKHIKISQEANINKNKQEDKIALEKKIKETKAKLKEEIKHETCMKNNDFLNLLCLMRLKKESLYENNPYIVEYTVTLDSVYKSKINESEGERRDLFEKFESDLNKYVD